MGKTSRQVLLQREGVLLVDPRNGFDVATRFPRREDAEAALHLLWRMRDTRPDEDLRQLRGMRLQVEEKGDEAGSSTTGKVVAILPAEEERETPPAGFLSLWNANRARRVKSAAEATRFTDEPSADGAGAFLQSRFPGLVAAGERRRTQDHENEQRGEG